MNPHMGVSENLGYLMLGPYSKDSYYFGNCIRVPYFRKLPYLNSGPNVRDQPGALPPGQKCLGV